MVVVEIGSIKVLCYTYFRLLIAVEKMDGLYILILIQNGEALTYSVMKP